jgi:carboxyl-terminal processing protease
MKKMMLLLVGVLFWTGTVGQTNTTAQGVNGLQPLPQQPREAVLITQFLAGYHYNKIKLDDSLSSVVFDNIFHDLDPTRAYFLQKEITDFEHYRYVIDEHLPAGNLEFGFAVFSLYRTKAIARFQFIYKVLEKELDFDKDEYFEVDRQNAPWPKSEREQDDLWRKIIKNQALPYKLAGREWPDIAKALTERYQRVEKALNQYTSEDAFQVYMNAFTTAYDPHTNYFSPTDAEDFEIDMSLSLEGIGARLQQQLDYTVVTDIIPGGPAFKGKELQENDKIIGIAQGDEGVFEDVIGWRISEVVRKIRGPKGTVVRLQVLKHSKGANALPDTIRIVRDKIKLEEQEAKAEVIPFTENGKDYKLGVITIPSFYINFDERNKGVQDYKSTTRDVKKLISDLQDQDIDGLMIDLRYNGGGSLDEAIELTGLFIPDGPVVQVRDMRNQVEKLNDTDNGKVLYDGPLTVLVNRYSASASEIFAGAIQDYKRGVIVGENSFGKGTVQNIVDLGPQLQRQMNSMITLYQQRGDQKSADELKQLRTYLITNKIDLGQLKMTMAKFYRVTGNSTQRVGVAPDVHFPTPFDPSEVGENRQENALPWDEILSAQFKPTNQIDQKMIDQLNELYRQHLNEDPDLKKLVAEIERAKKNQNMTSVSLNLEQRRNSNTTSNLEEELDAEIATGDVQEKEDVNRLSKDPYLKEAIRLLAELARKSIG